MSNGPKPLSQNDANALHAQLLRRFPTFEAFSAAVSRSMGRNVEEIVSKGPLNSVFDQFLRWADAEGLVEEVRCLLRRGPPRRDDPRFAIWLINIAVLLAVLGTWLAWFYFYHGWITFYIVSGAAALAPILGFLANLESRVVPGFLTDCVGAILDSRRTWKVCLCTLAALALLSMLCGTVHFTNTSDEDLNIWTYRGEQTAKLHPLPTAKLRPRDSHREPFFVIPFAGTTVQVKAAGCPTRTERLGSWSLRRLAVHDVSRPVVLILTSKPLAELGNEKLLLVKIDNEDVPPLKGFLGEPVVVGASAEMIDEFFRSAENAGKFRGNGPYRVLSTPLEEGSTVMANLRSPLFPDNPNKEFGTQRIDRVAPGVQLMTFE